MINQLLPTISYGDAVSNSAVNMMKVLHSMGIKSNIYAQNIHPKMGKFARPAHECPKDQMVIYHLSTGSDLAYEIPNFRKKKIMVYHNITPPDFFRGYSGGSQTLCEEGRKQLHYLKDYVDYALSDSEYNNLELIEIGYKISDVTPIIINYEDYDKKPNEQLIQKLKQDKKMTNILFVGRIAPNKKQDDIIKTFYYYKKYINNDSRLFLVGSYQGMERYYYELVSLVKQLKLEDVYLSGHISFDEILAYYKCADLFLCMSEHEGFCVPVLEAMYFEVPIVAFKSSAIGETLGNGGILSLDKDYKVIAELINIVMSSKQIKSQIIKNQKVRLRYYSKENTRNIFKNHIETLITSS
jgi:glycosyltransferase involved in cell wall biosynthesis